MASMVAQQGLTVVPLKAYFNSRSCLKIKIAVARGKAPTRPTTARYITLPQPGYALLQNSSLAAVALARREKDLRWPRRLLPLPEADLGVRSLESLSQHGLHVW